MHSIIVHVCDFYFFLPDYQFTITLGILIIAEHSAWLITTESHPLNALMLAWLHFKMSDTGYLLAAAIMNAFNSYEESMQDIICSINQYHELISPELYEIVVNHLLCVLISLISSLIHTDYSCSIAQDYRPENSSFYKAQKLWLKMERKLYHLTKKF